MKFILKHYLQLVFALCTANVRTFFSFKDFSYFRPEDRIFCLNIQEMINNRVAVTIPFTKINLNFSSLV